MTPCRLIKCDGHFEGASTFHPQCICCPRTFEVLAAVLLTIQAFWDINIKSLGEYYPDVSKDRSASILKVRQSWRHPRMLESSPQPPDSLISLLHNHSASLILNRLLFLAPLFRKPKTINHVTLYVLLTSI